MTIKEFFESDEKLAIHCNTKEKAKKLLEVFDREGYEWFDGEKYTEDTCWTNYGVETCYDNEYQYADTECYQNKDYKILEFEDIELGDTFKNTELVGGIKFEPIYDLSQFTTDELLQEIKRRIKG